MFRGNGAHTFYGTGPVSETAPAVRWRFETDQIINEIRGKRRAWKGTGWTGTAVHLAGVIFVGSVDGYVYAFDAAWGKMLWRSKRRRMFKSSPCLYRNRLYVGNTDNRLRCFDAQTGQVLWSHDTGRDLDSSPCVVDGRLYVAGESGYARCLDPLTGRVIWRTFLGGVGRGTVAGSNGSETSPAVSDGEYYAATYDGKLHALDAKSGRVRWVAETGDDTDASPVIYDEFVYAAAEEKASYLYCFDRQTGRQIWRYDGNDKGYFSTPAVGDGRLWVGGVDGKLHCVDARRGTALWTFDAGAPIWSSPCVIDDKVVFGAHNGRIYCVDAVAGREIWNVPLGGRILSSPCIVDGTIWIGTATGYFYCLG